MTPTNKTLVAETLATLAVSEMARTPTPAALAQSFWYINPITGSDENNGSQAHPLKTALEYTRRTGVARVLSTQVDIFIEGSLAATDALILSARLATPNAHLNAHGVPTVLHGGTLSGAVPYNQLTGQWDELQDGSLDWTPFVGKMVQVFPSNARCYVLKAIAPGRARVGWLTIPDPSDIYTADVTPVFAGNTYEVLDLPFIPNYVEDIVGVAPGDISIAGSLVELLTFTPGTPPSQGFISCDSPEVVYHDCIMPAVETKNASLVNCLFTNIVYGDGVGNMTLCSALNAVLSIEGPTTGFGVILQASQIQCFTATGYYEAHHNGTGLGIFDCDTAVLCTNGGVFAVIGDVWGSSGNTTCLVEIDAGCRMILDSAYTVKLLGSAPGAPSDVLLNGKTAVPAIDPVTYAPSAARTLTFANLVKTFANGGFQGCAFDPRSPATSISAP